MSKVARPTSAYWSMDSMAINLSPPPARPLFTVTLSPLIFTHRIIPKQQFWQFRLTHSDCIRDGLKQMNQFTSVAAMATWLKEVSSNGPSSSLKNKDALSFTCDHSLNPYPCYCPLLNFYALSSLQKEKKINMHWTENWNQLLNNFSRQIKCSQLFQSILLHYVHWSKFWELWYMRCTKHRSKRICNTSIFMNHGVIQGMPLQ